MNEFHGNISNTSDILLPRVTGDDIEMAAKRFEMNISIMKQTCRVNNKIRFAPPQDSMDVDVS